VEFHQLSKGDDAMLLIIKIVFIILFIYAIYCNAGDKILNQFEYAIKQTNPQNIIEIYQKIAKELNIKAISERIDYLSERCCTDDSYWGTAKEYLARLEIELAAAITNKYKLGIPFLIQRINLSGLGWAEIRVTDLDSDVGRRYLFSTTVIINFSLKMTIN
jgi:hypothetical protein